MPKVSRTHTDLHVGKTIRSLRRDAGLSQSDLAAVINVTYQQFQKYEQGANRLSLHNLIEIAKALNVPLSAITGESEGADPLILSKEEQKLLQAFKNIETDDHKRQIIALAKSLAKKS